MKKYKIRNIFMLFIVGFFVVILGIAFFMTAKNTSDLQDILHESVRSQLISISIAARGIIDVDKFYAYNSMQDIENDAEAYGRTLSELRMLREETGVTYIYALKMINGLYCFVFDTDTEDDTRFTEYKDMAQVHKQAFLGKDSAGILNVVDEWGSFNTGAVPIWKDGKVIGVISTDIEDSYIRKSGSTARANTISLILAMFASMCVVVAVTVLQLRNIRKMQDKLFYMANYDDITGLHNRHYLMNYLEQITGKSNKTKTPFALMFIDLDNFKMVNDGAGHDAGDNLLRHIAAYLDSTHESSKSFRPSAGILNISARVGGDEFIQIVPGVKDEADAEIAAKKMIDHFNSNTLSPFIEKFGIGLSIGVAMFPLHSDNFNVLIKYADIAMYHAKNSGKHTYRVFDFEMGPKNMK